jgi:hypothetical protein
MHPHDAALALIGLFQEGSADSSVADSVADELEFLTLGDNYVDDIDRIADVADWIAVSADGKALLPIWNLGEGFVLLQSLFNDFGSNIIWEDNNDEEEEATGMVMFHSSVEGHDQFSNGHSRADGEEAYRSQ